MIRSASRLLLAVAVALGMSWADAMESDVTLPALALVSYVEVAPAATQAAADALRRYRDELLRAAHARAVRVVEQRDLPGRFVVLEEWGGTADRDSDTVRASVAALQDRLRSIRLSSYDERAYRVLAYEGVSAAQDAAAIVVVAHVDIAGLAEGAPQLLAGYVSGAAREAGHVSSELCQGQARANHYTLIETWKDADAWEAHRLSVQRRQFREAIEPMTGSPLDERIYHLLR